MSRGAYPQDQTFLGPKLWGSHAEPDMNAVAPFSRSRRPATANTWEAKVGRSIAAGRSISAQRPGTSLQTSPGMTLPLSPQTARQDRHQVAADLQAQLAAVKAELVAKQALVDNLSSRLQEQLEAVDKDQKKTAVTIRAAALHREMLDSVASLQMEARSVVEGMQGATVSVTELYEKLNTMRQAAAERVESVQKEAEAWMKRMMHDVKKYLDKKKVKWADDSLNEFKAAARDEMRAFAEEAVDMDRLRQEARMQAQEVAQILRDDLTREFSEQLKDMQAQHEQALAQQQVEHMRSMTEVSSKVNSSIADADAKLAGGLSGLEGKLESNHAALSKSLEDAKAQLATSVADTKAQLSAALEDSQRTNQQQMDALAASIASLAAQSRSSLSGLEEQMKAAITSLDEQTRGALAALEAQCRGAIVALEEQQMGAVRSLQDGMVTQLRMSELESDKKLYAAQIDLTKCIQEAARSRDSQMQANWDYFAQQLHQITSEHARSLASANLMAIEPMVMRERVDGLQSELATLKAEASHHLAALRAGEPPPGTHTPPQGQPGTQPGALISAVEHEFEEDYPPAPVVPPHLRVNLDSDDDDDGGFSDPRPGAQPPPAAAATAAARPLGSAASMGEREIEGEPEPWTSAAPQGGTGQAQGPGSPAAPGSQGTYLTTQRTASEDVLQRGPVALAPLKDSWEDDGAQSQVSSPDLVQNRGPLLFAESGDMAPGSPAERPGGSGGGGRDALGLPRRPEISEDF